MSTKLEQFKQDVYTDVVIFFSELNFEEEVNDYITWKDYDVEELVKLRYNDIESELNDTDFFNSEIIGYGQAMELLLKHDTSLTRSVQRAIDVGFTLEKINSELLASLLSEEILREEFKEHKDKIDDFFEELEEKLEELEDEVWSIEFDKKYGLNDEEED